MQRRSRRGRAGRRRHRSFKRAKLKKASGRVARNSPGRGGFRLS